MGVEEAIDLCGTVSLSGQWTRAAVRWYPEFVELILTHVVPTLVQAPVDIVAWERRLEEFFAHGGPVSGAFWPLVRCFQSHRPWAVVDMAIRALCRMLSGGEMDTSSARGVDRLRSVLREFGRSRQARYQRATVGALHMACSFAGHNSQYHSWPRSTSTGSSNALPNAGSGFSS